VRLTLPSWYLLPQAQSQLAPLTKVSRAIRVEGTGGDQPLSYADPGFGGMDLLLTNVRGKVASRFGEGKGRLQVRFGEITLCAPHPLEARKLSFKHNVTPFHFFFFFVPSGLWKHALYCYTATSLNSIWEINGLLKNRQNLDCHQETHKSKHVKSVMETERGPLEFSRVEAGLYTCPSSSSCTVLLGAHMEGQWKSLFVLEINESLVM